LIYGDDRYGDGDGGSLSGAKDLDIMGLACAPKGVAKLAQGEGCGGFVVEPGYDVTLDVTLLRRPAFSAGEAARIPVTTKVCRSSPLAREKKCCDHYF
jgi:hypothetical protein